MGQKSIGVVGHWLLLAALVLANAVTKVRKCTNPIASEVFKLLPFPLKIYGQDYEVANIKCSFGDSDDNDGDVDKVSSRQHVHALLRKPEGFKGDPIFADDRKVNPYTDPNCQIRPASPDEDELLFNLFIKDLSKCGVLVKNVSNQCMMMAGLSRAPVSSHFILAGLHQREDMVP